MLTTDTRGYAMPAAIGGLVIVGVLVTAGFYMARQEVRIGVASKHSAMAVNIAQAGANEIMANWNGFNLGNIPIGDDTTLVGTMNAGDWEVTVRNLNGFVYFISAAANVTEGGAMWAGANRRIGIVTRIIYAQINPPAALMTRGTVTLRGGAAVDGTDSDPDEWTGYCPGTTENKPGVLTNDTSVVTTEGSSTLEGDPPKDQDSTIVDSTFTNFGDMDWAELTDLAQAEGKDVTSLGSTITQTLPDSTGPGECNESTLSNWGDPLEPAAACGSYFPLIYWGGTGDPPHLTINSNGYGQGVLLVDGNLTLKGGFVFYGIIIVQGAFITEGSGARIVGGVMASNSDLNLDDIAGSSVVQQSTCASQRAILNNSSLSRARPLTTRSWVDLTNVTN